MLSLISGVEEDSGRVMEGVNEDGKAALFEHQCLCGLDLELCPGTC